MKILVVGSGGREHALCWKIAQSPLVKKIFCAPGNAGIAKHARCIPIGAEQIEKLAEFAWEEKIDLTVVGPEAPLVMGIEDLFRKRGLKLCGPSKEAAVIEGSKAYAKNLMKKYGIPTANFKIFDDPEAAAEYIHRNNKRRLVLKADGLAAGKGVIPTKNEEEALSALNKIMIQKAFGDAGNRIVMEDFLKGEEASFIVFTDGENIYPMPTSQDHKPVYDNDEGPNTGGMGAYSPAPVINEKMYHKIINEIMRPIINAMAAEDRPYKGILYAGLMISGEDVKVLEFNCRMGDPEAQPLLVRLESDIVPLLVGAAEGNIKNIETIWSHRPSVCVVMASAGYPGHYEKRKEIKGLSQAEAMEDVVIFHAATKFENGKYYTNGGRVLGVTATGNNLKEAIERTYEAVSKIWWDGVHYRKDIGKKGLLKLAS